MYYLYLKDILQYVYKKRELSPISGNLQFNVL